nr:MAG TPA: hypothetical protein [Caudoviricetes sp.]
MRHLLNSLLVSIRKPPNFCRYFSNSLIGKHYFTA